ncbi:Uncharacterised protein [Mycobacteroides abscessus subsp. abscessus]|nr:Uncharacterised protein [Mycobacteroides abscessus subsp. abscessus]
MTFEPLLVTLKVTGPVVPSVLDSWQPESVAVTVISWPPPAAPPWAGSLGVQPASVVPAATASAAPT